MDSERSESRVLTGLAASSGIAVGRLQVVDRRRHIIDEYSISAETVSDQIGRITNAFTSTREEMEALRQHLEAKAGNDHLFIIDAHLLILSDDHLLTETCAIIESHHINAEAALQRVLQRYRSLFAQIEDEYLRERISDIETVVERVLSAMVGTAPAAIISTDGHSIIVAHDLTPADILQLDRSRVVGIVTEIGGRSSHTSILARAFELPAIVGVEGCADTALDGLAGIVDGIAGKLIVNPGSDTFRECLQRKQRFDYVEHELLKTADLPPVTLDGHRLALKGNVEIPEEGPSVLRHGGEGSGLYRTEMLFMGRQDMPGEEEQYQVYSAMQRAVAPHPLTIRTLDAGGDKLMEGGHSREQNPALGVRAIRLALGMPDEFRKQLRAILRLSASGPVRVMFPMISGLEELRQAKQLLDEVRTELDAQGIDYDRSMPVGIMIEVPSAVQIADLLARESDFFSVGTNDLIQYSLAIDRSSEQLAAMFQPLHPAVLRSLRSVVAAARQAGIPASICGEMAGDPFYLPLLLGLGFDELSMSAGAIPRVKQALRSLTRARAVEIAETCLGFSTAVEVEAFLRSALAGDGRVTS